MIAQTTDLPAEPTYTTETVNASRPSARKGISLVAVSFAVATIEKNDEQELVRPAAMVQRVLDHLDEPIAG
jgi:hypothetical protein